MKVHPYQTVPTSAEPPESSTESPSPEPASAAGAASEGVKAPEPCAPRVQPVSQGTPQELCAVCDKPGDVKVVFGPFEKTLCKRCAKIGYRTLRVLGAIFGPEEN